MGWQDRDYARREAQHRPVGYTTRPTLLGRRSIVTMLIIINVAIYVLGNLNRTVGDYVYGFGAMQARAVVHGQVWRLWSRQRLFAIYTLCGLCGNVFYTILGSRGVIDPEMPAVGASGCIYGLLGIAAVLFPTATVYVYFLFPIKIRTAAIVFGGIAFLTILGRGKNYGGEACHLAGLVFGVWWAMMGDRWWASTRWRLPRWRSRPKRPTTKSKGFAVKVAERRADAETIDRILRKVYDGGIHSLSEAEKRALREATERQHQREQEAGRVDRL